MAENPIFSYTKRDYERSRQEGMSQIPVISKGRWTDLNATDPGIIILDYVHALVDMINYYQDHQALETFISTAKERANIFRLAKQLSYNIRSAKGAVCDVTFTALIAPEYTIKIPKYTAISTKTQITYLTSQDAYLPAGEYSVTVPCTQGNLVTMTYQGTGISRLSSVPNAQNQSIRIVDTNIDIDSIVITDNIGRTWKPVDYILFSDSSERAYQVELNPDNSVTVKFGDGERGIVPSDTDLLTITYISSLAEEGRVSENTLILLDADIYDSEGRYIEFRVNNEKSSSGGSSVPSSQEIRELAPGAIKAQDRAVTLEDFENLAKLVDGVEDATAYDINLDDTCLPHEVKVLIIPSDTGESAKVIETNVYNFLSPRMIPPTNLTVKTPSYIPIDVHVSVLKRDNYSEGEVIYNIEQALINYFEDKSKELGITIYPADITAIVSMTKGVKNIISLTPSNPIQMSLMSSCILGVRTIDVM